jgi:DNA-binding response OmpR family regulator
MSRMLIGEMHEDLASAMKEFFSQDHYTVELGNNGMRILERLRQYQYDVVVLEIALPGLDAMDIARGYRATGGSAPIALLAGRHSSIELQCGLDAGADAYFVKPFLLADLAARLRALLRRPSLRSAQVLRMGGIAMDTLAGTATKNDTLIHLHPMEFKLLQYLLSHPNRVFDAHTLFEQVWQKEFGAIEDTVRTHVKTLRQKIDSAGCASVITTVRGLGYKASDQQ